MNVPDLDLASMGELIELRDRVTRALKARFEKSLALLFTDVVGSTAYLAEHGDVAGRVLLKRHHDLLARALADTSGRVIDTAGDGAFCVAATAADGAAVLTRLQRLLLEDNSSSLRQHRLEVRSGLHYGPVLTDAQQVSGEAVHLAARIMGSSQPGEIRISEQAFRELPATLRPRCRRLGAQTLKGIGEAVEMLVLDWRDPERFAVAIEIVEAPRVEPIPCQARVSIGRLDEHDGKAANDVVIGHPDPSLEQRLSRWHAELEMTPEGYRLRALSRAATEVDGQALAEGETRLVRPGSTARLGKVLTLRFLAAREPDEATIVTSGQEL